MHLDHIAAQPSRWRYSIYYASREYAQEHGDPCVGEVWASSKSEAERLALLQLAIPAGVGAWAVRQSPR